MPAEGSFRHAGTLFFSPYMKIHLIAVGRTADPRLQSLIADYVDRLEHYVPFRLEIIPELKNTKSISTEQQRQREGMLILKSLQDGDHVILLDEKGKELRSVEFAASLERLQQAAARRLVFVIGGPYGFSEEVYRRASGKLSLSRMTFSHQMVRLFFVEQCYRAMTILKGQPYHHE